ncbi:MAG: hypothetical protein F6J97_12180, partial [Leptolyngbya sp. SIO4C1]|nr:hypothetical protein [Leptolyngbya sp. SIO4C1]
VELARSALQAAEIAQEIPGEMSASEYYSVALALLYSTSLDRVPMLLEQGIERAENPNEHTALLRLYGSFLMNSGEVSKGRSMLEKALSVWDKYPNTVEYYRKQTNGYTELFWAQTEYAVRNLEATKEHLRKASEIADSLPQGPATTQFAEQLNYFKLQVDQGNLMLPAAIPIPDSPEQDTR